MNDGVHQLVLESLDASTWRLSDRAVPRGNANAILGCVERMGDGVYEVIWLVGGLSKQQFSSLESVLLAGVARIHGAAAEATMVHRI